MQPISFPTTQPSHVPTEQPSKQPSMQPSNQPSAKPSLQPSVTPTNMPTMQPSITPTAQPSVQPSSTPSTIPTMQPTTQPAISPSIQPTSQPSRTPSCQPSTVPSSKPSSQPSRQPTTLPSLQPTSQPSGSPSSLPSNQPRGIPTQQPTGQPSVEPSKQPIRVPTTQPSTHPSRQPSSQPSRQPICRPSRQPSSQPTRRPHSYPTSKPTSIPTELLLPLSQFESRKPSRLPTIRPTRLPTKMPTAFPSFIPTASPTESLPLHTELSVHFSLNVTQNIRIVLPFLFTSVLGTEALADVYIGTPLNGTSYVILGGRDLNYRVHVSSLLYFIPAYVNDFSGRSVSNAGDVNGDGFDDLIIGVPYASRCYVLFGNENGFVNMTDGFTILGTKSSDLTGWSVSGAGDVNNDTYADIIIGAPGGGGVENGGVVYIIYGKGTTFVLIDLSNLSPLDGYAIHGVDSWEYLGISVSNAGDVDDDGFDDVIVGALRLNVAFSGAMYIVFGHKSNLSVSQHLETMLTVDSIEVKGSANSWFGYSVDAAGDVNGDGFADVIVGSIPHKALYTAPAVSYLIFGNRTMSVSSMSSMTASQGVVITGGGVVVSGVGDLNGDGFDDVLIGSGFRFDSGGGFVLNFPTSLLNVQTPASIPIPSIPPSRSPSASPSVMPSIAPSWRPTIRPTAPTVVPTMTPSGPTKLPTMTPTQPTSIPTAEPSAPSLNPTELPTVKPSAAPTLSPSESPSAFPSTTPSAMPSIEWTYRPTTTAVPSLAPTELWMLNPTRHPVVRPTLSPTTIAPSRAPTVFSTVIEVSLHSGFTNRTQIGIIYIVNATSNVRFQSGRGNDTFLILPNTHSVVTIEQFHVSDLIDLRMFSEYSSIDDLNITEIQRDRVDETRRFLILASLTRQVDVLITLRQNQVIWLLNQRKADLILANFIFAGSFKTTKRKKEKEKIYNNIIAIGSGSFVSAVLLLFLCWKLYHCWRSEDKILKLRNKVVSWQEELQSNGTFVTIYHQDFSLQSMDIESDGSSSTGSGTLSKKQSQSRSHRMDYDIVGMEIVYPTLGNGHGGHSAGNSSNNSSLSTRRDSVGSHVSNMSKEGYKVNKDYNESQSSVITRQDSFALYASNNVPCEVHEETEYNDHCDLLQNSLPSPLPTTQHDSFLMYNEPHGDIECQGQHIDATENSLTRQNSFTLYVDSKIPQELNEDIDYRSNNNNIIPQEGFDEEMFQNITNIFQTSQEYGQNRHQYSSTLDVTVTNSKSINSLHLPKPRFRLKNVRQAIQAYEWYAIEAHQRCEEDADSNSSHETV